MSKPKSSASPSLIHQLCLQCGLCCDGTLFRDVQLRSRDRIKPLLDAGIPVRKTKLPLKIPQPCAALGKDLLCSAYQHRPCHCRTFECGVLLRTQKQELDVPDALRVIRKAKRLRARILRLLDQLDDPDDQIPLKRRFERVLRGSMGSENRGRSAADRTTDHLLGDLSVAMHELNLMLAQHFYE